MACWVAFLCVLHFRLLLNNNYFLLLLRVTSIDIIMYHKMYGARPHLGLVDGQNMILAGAT